MRAHILERALLTCCLPDGRQISRECCPFSQELTVWRGYPKDADVFLENTALLGKSCETYHGFWGA